MTTGIGVDKASEFAPKDFERLLLRTLTAMKKGDFTARMPVEFTGTAGKIADSSNFCTFLPRRREVGRQQAASSSTRAEDAIGDSESEGPLERENW